MEKIMHVTALIETLDEQEIAGRNPGNLRLEGEVLDERARVGRGELVLGLEEMDRIAPGIFRRRRALAADRTRRDGSGRRPDEPVGDGLAQPHDLLGEARTQWHFLSP